MSLNIEKSPPGSLVKIKYTTHTYVATYIQWRCILCLNTQHTHIQCYISEFLSTSHSITYFLKSTIHYRHLPHFCLPLMYITSQE